MRKNQFQWRKRKISNGAIETDYGPLVSEIILYIEAHYSEHLTLSALAAMCRLSQAALTQHFKQETGTTVMRYVMNYRIRTAEKFLAADEMPIKEISARCGFKTVQHFTRVFKAQTGQTPLRFRKAKMKTV
ncbi:MAG: helix-turn-helix transcriptional regulator [Clostridia bacterium]|nr:helix-turn-helix transcriptional regulator [Clostridia bacterium]